MTTPYHIHVSPAALRQLKALIDKQRKFVLQLIESLAVNPRPPGCRKIEGMTGLYCQEINHVRLIYKIEEHEVLLLLVK